MSGQRFICIHGHFYQPPRENPWLEAVETQDSAYPYHDWNERVTAECYAPNARSRILDDKKRIIKIVNNYARISFNFGPTLLAWLERQAPTLYAAILDADRQSQRAYSGHGSALAQVYNHMIMPLAVRRDRYTQTLWGIRDFLHRFNRWPEGMWLPETAVDLMTLDLLAEFGIKFTILAAHQARRVRKIGEPIWRDVSGAVVDPTMPYIVRLPSGGSIAVFIYDGPIARAVAFERLLTKGENFVARLMAAFDPSGSRPQLVNIATDGETYGHHHRFGDMALAYALDYISGQDSARITNYGEYLATHPPTHELEVMENTAWSCAHGVERWRSNCGCNSGSHPGWQQTWRTPLRETFDWLRDELASQYESAAGELLNDPWVARNEYANAVIDRSQETLERFLAAQAARTLSARERIRVRKLLEMQRHLMLMYHSCGWFFDDPSGIETIGVMQCAARAMQLATELYATDWEGRFLQRLKSAASNVRELGDAAEIYSRSVKPTVVDLNAVCAHAAIRSLFANSGNETTVHCYQVRRDERLRQDSGRAKLGIGRAVVSSSVTGEEVTLAYGVLHLGGLNLAGGVREELGDAEYQALIESVRRALGDGDLLQVIRLLDHHFHGLPYSLKSLFRDDQRRVLGEILTPTLAEAEAVYREFYERSVEILRFLTDNQIPPPEGFREAARFAFNASLKRELSATEPDWERVGALVTEAHATGVALDEPGLALLFKQAAERATRQFGAAFDQYAQLTRLMAVVDQIQALPFFVNLWEVQNMFYDLRQAVYPGFGERASRGDADARRWAEQFVILGEKLAVRVE
jgi:alpha-amylase/alpha-mannosidase (GH57 family)